MRIIYTVGHSNGSFESFLQLLRMHKIDVIADVRSSPYSRYAVHFNRESVQASLRLAGLKYVYMGKQIGGMPEDPSLYDDQGNLDYQLIISSEVFKFGIGRLVTGLEKYCIALMCGEENPAGCHRRHLLAPALQEFDIEVRHIRANGSLNSEADLAAPKKVRDGLDLQQLSLFGD